MALLGKGPVFRGGMDPNMMSEFDQQQQTERGGKFRRLLDTIEGSRTPVVAGINRSPSQEDSNSPCRRIYGCLARRLSTELSRSMGMPLRV